MDGHDGVDNTLDRLSRVHARKRSLLFVHALVLVGESLSMYVAVIFLFAGSLSTTQAQAQDNTSDATPGSQSGTAAPSRANTTLFRVPNTTIAPATPTSSPIDLVLPVPVPTVTTSSAPPVTLPDDDPGDAVVDGESNISPTIPPPITPNPTDAVTVGPTVTPTTSPSLSSGPSSTPTLSLVPTISSNPTGQPSTMPTGKPSWAVPSFKENKFRQEITVGNGRELEGHEIVVFQLIYQLQTTEFAQDYDGLLADEAFNKIDTVCKVDKQLIEKPVLETEVGERRIFGYFDDFYGNDPIWLEDEFGNITSGLDHPPEFLRRRRRRRRRRLRRRAQEGSESVKLLVDFTMTYESSYFNVTQYPRHFQTWTNSNLENVKNQMQTLSLNVTGVERIQRIVVNTPAPTVSISFEPTDAPTENPTITPEPSERPSPSTSLALERKGVETNSVIAISISILVAFAILITGVFFWYRKRRTSRGMEHESKMEHQSISVRPIDLDSHSRGTNATAALTTQFATNESKAYGSAFGKPAEALPGLSGVGGVVSPNGSLHSNPSLVSEGNPFGEDSEDELDTTQNLADLLDKFQDQNMEIMRANVEENLAGCDGMMSQAVARALIDDVDHDASSDIYWGGDMNISAPEIEASALASVMDWLKRNDKSSDRERRDFFQESLNKMTASVRYNVVHPEDGARTIHECAGLLGLQLAVEIPVTTILISGMRRSTTEDDIRYTFSAFGEISVAAVAPKHKGYGIMRFSSDIAVERVMKKFRTEEILLDDVAVQLRVIRPGANVGAAELNGII
mmetsp:Transcript_24680/g.68138  ORF Transcript_24680/g.68138 Transcript_24680/m.68138 type:complete len:795 (+) Transcript_24680:323-2707(+)|eukprot:CAMPEP_0172363918 /NCGR_PEP_ID=MMETSP1060-20121228/7145_1 /TAXON_ID=37318 /ORGANISM="Pseudo-nitzschia pungens, Strain cf. cingulata" /LENGTH=794 /DNA_ID=CAMNT_0013086777 /DNA_START=226 /DNA_END=2610 /DNA_ORIENTATION=-